MHITLGKDILDQPLRQEEVGVKWELEEVGERE